VSSLAEAGRPIGLRDLGAATLLYTLITSIAPGRSRSTSGSRARRRDVALAEGAPRVPDQPVELWWFRYALLELHRDPFDGTILQPFARISGTTRWRRCMARSHRAQTFVRSRSRRTSCRLLLLARACVRSRSRSISDSRVRRARRGRIYAFFRGLRASVRGPLRADRPLLAARDAARLPAADRFSRAAWRCRRASSALRGAAYTLSTIACMSRAAGSRRDAGRRT